MSDLRARLIEAAVRPLSDNAELKHAAADFLKKRVAENADVTAMLERWDEMDARKRKSVWSIGLWVMVVGVSAGVAFSGFDEFHRLIHWGKWLAAGSMFTPAPQNSLTHVAHRLNDEEKLLLFGDPTRESKSERKQALWQSEPENPAYFADYACAFLADEEALPPDFLEIARRIDPANAWFTYLAAAVEAKDSVKTKPRKSRQVDGKTVDESPQSWEILDPSRLDRVMALLVEARNQPNCDDYSASMLRQRLPLLPEDSFIDQLDSGACLAETSTFSSFRLLRLAQAIAAKACSLGESGDVAGFKEVTGDGDKFIRGICSNEPGTIVEEMAKTIMVGILANSFRSAAETLSLEPDAARWKLIDEWVIDGNERRRSRKFIVDGKAVEPGTITGGIVGGSIEIIANRPNIPLTLRDADLQPMRLVDHEVLSWVFSHVCWIVLALGIGILASYRFRVGVLSRFLAVRMKDLLRSSDWVWILVMGVVLPIVYVMSVNRLTPLGGRAFGVQGTSLLMPVGHFLGLLLLWLIVPVQVVRWRLAKRAGGFGFAKPSWMGWLALACAVAFVPMIGWAAISNFDGPWMEGMRLSSRNASEAPWQLWAAVALAGLAALWVTGLISLAVFGRADGHLYRATSSVVLIPTYGVAMLMIAFASIGFKASERYWFSQDRLSKFDLSGPGWNAYESQAAAQMRKELREMLGYTN